MKTRKYIAVIFAAMVMGISGCNDDLFLEEHPDTFYTAEDAFKTVDQVKACVTNMYAHARYWLQNDVFLKGALRGLLSASELCQPDFGGDRSKDLELG